MLTPKELADRWYMSRGTLANWRLVNFGPRFQRRGWLIFYPMSEARRMERLVPELLQKRSQRVLQRALSRVPRSFKSPASSPKKSRG